MTTDDADELVAFSDVTVVRATVPALLCRIGDRSVWLPRGEITGMLWAAGDRGKLLIRRWVARDRELMAPHRAPISDRLPLERSGGEVDHAK